MRPLMLTAATAVITTLVAGVAQADTIRFWTTENQPERLAKQQAMADDFNKKTGHTVEVIPVEEKDLGTRATAAFAAGALPDVIYHTLQYVLPWAEAGIRAERSAPLPSEEFMPRGEEHGRFRNSAPERTAERPAMASVSSAARAAPANPNIWQATLPVDDTH